MRFRRNAKPEFREDFPDTAESVTEAIQAIPPAPWHGTTVPLAALSGQPRYMPPGVEPYPAPPAAVLPLPQARAVMTVNPPRPGGPGPTPQALEVARFLRAKVIILKRRGHVDRISDDKLAMLPCDRIRNRRTTARLIVDEAAELLLCGEVTR